VLGLSLSAAIGLLVAIASATGAGQDALTFFVRELPGGGLLRDAQKWLAPWALLLALLFALAIERVAGIVRDRVQRRAVLVGAAVACLALLPDLAWGVGGRLEPARYPASWEAVRTRLEAGPPGDVALLPWQAFRAYGWNDARTVLDPAPRFLSRRTVGSDALPVGRVVVPGDDRHAAAVEAVLQRPDPVPALARLGVRWVLVQTDQPGPVPSLPGANVVFDQEGLRLLVLPIEVRPRALPWWAPLVVVADALAVVVLGWCVVLVTRGRRELVRLSG
jgi:hypothetical protein